MEGLKVSESNMVVYVHPSKSSNIYDAILRELSSLLFTYNEHFDGVVLAYEFDVLDNSSGMKIRNGLFPYLSVRIKAKLFLFSPKPDMILEGKIAKVTQGSVHLIVLGFASAVIAEEDIRNEFEYKIKHGEEVFSSKLHKRHIIKVGEMIRFLVKSFDEDILHISGSLIPPQTGNIQWLAKNSQDDTVTDRSILKIEYKEESTRIDNGTVSGEPLSVDNEHKTKKSKKAKRHREES